MSNLELIKPKTHTIQVGKKKLELKFTLESFAHLEEEFGSVVEAVKLFNEKDETAIRQILSSILKEDFKYIEITNKIISTLATAMSDSISQDYNFEDEIDWALLYYIIKPALNMSEVEFWNSTHRQMFGYLKTLERHGKEVEAKNNQELAIKELMSW